MSNGTFSIRKETIRIIDLFHTFYKKENDFPVLTFSRLPKSKMMSVVVCEHALQSLHSKQYDLMLKWYVF